MTFLSDTFGKKVKMRGAIDRLRTGKTVVSSQLTEAGTYTPGQTVYSLDELFFIH